MVPDSSAGLNPPDLPGLLKAARNVAVAGEQPLNDPEDLGPLLVRSLFGEGKGDLLGA